MVQMEKVIILGSASAVPDLQHENTYLCVLTETHRVLIDAPGNPVVRLESAGIELLSLTDLIVTHFHPDHAAGVPLLLMVSWLLGRKDPLHIYGLEPVLQRVANLMDAYEWATWPKMFPCVFHNLPAEEMVPVIEAADLEIYASPVVHLVPNIGLRVAFLKSGRVLAYSSDTQPTPAVVRLAFHADVLLHEASGETLGHTSAAAAGAIAAEAGAKELYLIHYPTKKGEALLPQARQNFQGKVSLAVDFLEIDF
jgi:ribonuclease Z